MFYLNFIVLYILTCDSFLMQLPTGRRSGCDFYWLDGHFEMPEYPGQLNKFFGKNGFPTEKKHTDIGLFQPPRPLPPMEGEIQFNPPPPRFFKMGGTKEVFK